MNDRPPFVPNWRVPIEPHDDTTNKQPNIVVAIGLVEYGYQVDIYIDGQLRSIECRDFGGSYPIAELEARFAKVIERAIDKERARL